MDSNTMILNLNVHEREEKEEERQLLTAKTEEKEFQDWS